MLSLIGKKVLLTGASGGIGAKITKTMIEAGAVITLSGSNCNKLESFSKSFDYKDKYIVCVNLADRSACKNLVTQANELMEGLDIVICNAGLTADMPFMRISEDNFQEILDVNLISSFIINREAARLMMKNRIQGRIINVTSVVASTGNPGQMNYAAAKAGVEGMTRSLAREVASRGITVNAVAPGFIMSPMTDKLSDEQKNKITAGIPCGYIGKPEDVADLILFLSSNKSSYITGQTIHVNGGMYMN